MAQWIQRRPPYRIVPTSQFYHATMQINKRSEELVEHMESRTQQTAMDRLSKPTGSVKKTTIEAIPRHSFRPKINSNSKEILHAHHGTPYMPEPPPSASRVASGDVYTADGQLYNPEDDDPEASFASLRPNTPPKPRAPRGPSIAERR